MASNINGENKTEPAFKFSSQLDDTMLCHMAPLDYTGRILIFREQAVVRRSRLTVTDFLQY